MNRPREGNSIIIMTLRWWNSNHAKWKKSNKIVMKMNKVDKIEALEGEKVEKKVEVMKNKE